MNKFLNVENELDKFFMYIFIRYYFIKSYFECQNDFKRRYYII